MQIVIDINEETLNEIKHSGLLLCPRDRDNLINAISNATILPKEHGRLIDEYDIPPIKIRGIDPYANGYNHRTDEVKEAIKNAPTIIEVYKGEDNESK